jgi:hypothetical protein
MSKVVFDLDDKFCVSKANAVALRRAEEISISASWDSNTQESAS